MNRPVWVRVSASVHVDEVVKAIKPVRSISQYHINTLTWVCVCVGRWGGRRGAVRGEGVFKYDFGCSFPCV